jgi:hypothetical protein
VGGIGGYGGGKLATLEAAILIVFRLFGAHLENAGSGIYE